MGFVDIDVGLILNVEDLADIRNILQAGLQIPGGSGVVGAAEDHGPHAHVVPFGNVAQLVFRKSAAPAENEVRLQSKDDLLGGIAFDGEFLAGGLQGVVLGLQVLPDGAVQIGGARDVLIQPEVEHQFGLGLVGADDLLGAFVKGDLNRFLGVVVSGNGHRVMVGDRFGRRFRSGFLSRLGGGRRGSGSLGGRGLSGGSLGRRGRRGRSTLLGASHQGGEHQQGQDQGDDFLHSVSFFLFCKIGSALFLQKKKPFSHRNGKRLIEIIPETCPKRKNGQDPSRRTALPGHTEGG